MQPAGPLSTVTVQAPKDHAAASHFWAGGSFSFHDVLDAINPLQHLPVIGTIYRHVTGDKIGNVAEVVGDGIYGGLIGLASGALNVAVKEVTGKDIGENLIALVEGDERAAPGDPPAHQDPAPALQPMATPQSAAQIAERSGERSGETPAASAPAAAPPNTVKPLQVARGFLPIDTTDRGIMTLRATAATHSSPPVPLNLPPGTQLVNAAAPPLDFAAKMREGLDKYQALIAAKTQTTAAVNQVH